MSNAARQYDLGDGPPCPELGEHGRLYTTGLKGTLWCPVTQALFGPAIYDLNARNFKAGPLIRKGQQKQ